MFKTSLQHRLSLISEIRDKLAMESILNADRFACTMTEKLKDRYDNMVQKATESGDDTSRLWLSAHDSENTDGDQIGSSKALEGISKAYSGMKTVCETIRLDDELFEEALKQMADEIIHLKQAIGSLKTTQKNLEGFIDEHFDADYANRVEKDFLEKTVKTWLDMTNAYYGEGSEER